MNNLYRLGKSHISGGPKTFTETFENFFSIKLIEVSIFFGLFVRRSLIFIIINGNSRIFKQIIYYLFTKHIIILRVGGYLSVNPVERAPLRVRFKFQLRRIIMYINFIFSHKLLFQSKFSYNIHMNDFVLRKIIHKKKYTIIHNPTDRSLPNDLQNHGNYILVVEGAFGLKIHQDLLKTFSRRFKIIAAGNYDGPNIQNVKFLGHVSRDKISNLYLGKPLAFLSLEQFGCCPNSVIEALSHSTPVIGINNGALKELIGDGGKVFEHFPSESKVDQTLAFMVANYTKLSQKAFEESKKFNSNLVLKKYEEFFSDN